MVKGGYPLFQVAAGVAVASRIAYRYLLGTTPSYNLVDRFNFFFGSFSQVAEVVSIEETSAKVKELDFAKAEFEKELKRLDKETTRNSYVGLILIGVTFAATVICCCIVFRK